jgi:hypothetical protein
LIFDNRNTKHNTIIRNIDTLLFKKDFIHLQDRSCVGGNTGPKFCTFLSNGSRDSRSLHFSLVIDNNTGTILKVDEDTLLPAERLALSDNNSRDDLLTKFGLSLLDGAHDHITGTGLGKTIQSTTNIANSDNMEILGSRVISAVDNSGCWKTS